MFRDSSILRWRHYFDKYELSGQKCDSCGKIFFEKTGLCECKNKSFSKISLSGKGKIVSFTQIHSGPESFQEQSPYCIGLIDLEEGPRVTLQIIDCVFDDLKIGLNVELVSRKMYKSGDKGVIHYGLKARPVF